MSLIAFPNVKRTAGDRRVSEAFDVEVQGRWIIDRGAVDPAFGDTFGITPAAQVMVGVP